MTSKFVQSTFFCVDPQHFLRSHNVHMISNYTYQQATKSNRGSNMTPLMISWRPIPPHPPGATKSKMPWELALTNVDGKPRYKGINHIQDLVGHFLAPWWPFWILHEVRCCRQCRIVGCTVLQAMW